MANPSRRLLPYGQGYARLKIETGAGLCGSNQVCKRQISVVHVPITLRLIGLALSVAAQSA